MNKVRSTVSVVFVTGGRSFEKAEAVIRILRKLGPPYSLIAFLLNLLPFFVLNFLYDFIVRNRYRIFGKNRTCFIPIEKDRGLVMP